MNNAKVAAALNTISLAFGELAEALTDNATATVSVAPAPVWKAPETITVPSGAGLPEFAEVAAEIFPDTVVTPADVGSAAMCPKHRIPYTDGSYGPYCKEITDDPAWGKQKGDRLWCKITPKNAAEYLRITAAA